MVALGARDVKKKDHDVKTEKFLDFLLITVAEKAVSYVQDYSLFLLSANVYRYAWSW
jgi:hypothetical protein